MNDLQKHLVQLVRDALDQHWGGWPEWPISFKVCSQCGGILGAYVEREEQYEVCPLCSPQERQRVEAAEMDVLEAIYLHACAGWVPLVLRDLDVHPPADYAWEKVYCIFHSLAAQIVRETGMARSWAVINVPEDDGDDDEAPVRVAVCGSWNDGQTHLLLAQSWSCWRFSWDSLDEMGARLEEWYHAMLRKAKLADAICFLAGYTPQQLEGAAETVEDRMQDYLQWVQPHHEARREAEWEKAFSGGTQRDYRPGFGDDLCRASTILNTLARLLA